MKTDITNHKDLIERKEKFMLEVTRLLPEQKMLEEEHKRIYELVKQSKSVSDSKETTVTLEDLLDITNQSDELDRRDREFKKRASKLFTNVTPSNMFLIQEYFDTWIELSETMQVRFNYAEDRIEVKEQSL